MKDHWNIPLLPPYPYFPFAQGQWTVLLLLLLSLLSPKVSEASLPSAPTFHGPSSEWTSLPYVGPFFENRKRDPFSPANDSVSRFSRDEIQLLRTLGCHVSLSLYSVYLFNFHFYLSFLEELFQSSYNFNTISFKLEDYKEKKREILWSNSIEPSTRKRLSNPNK